MSRSWIAVLVVALAALAWWLAGAGDDAPVTGAGNANATRTARTDARREAVTDPEHSTPRAAITAGVEELTEQRGALRVHVTRAERSLPHVAVRIHARDGRAVDESLRVAVSDGDGRARFDDLPAGSWHVTLDRGPERDCEIAGGEVTELAFRIEPGFDAIVRVLDVNGARVPGATITLWAASRFSDAPAEDDGVAIGVSDGNGELALEALSSFGVNRAWVAAQHDVHGFTAARLVMPLVELHFDLAGATLLLHVTDEAALPLEGAHARAIPIDEPGSVVDGASRVLRHLACRARGDALGNLALAPLAPCDWRIEITHHGYERQRFVQRVTDATRIVRDVVLLRAARVHGRVTTTDGTPIAGAEVRIQVEPRGGRVESSSDGRFHVDGLSPGEGTFVVDHERFESSTGPLVLERERDLELPVTLTARPVLRGRIVDERDAALAGFDVEANSLEPGYSDERRTASSTGDGAFELMLRRDVGYALLVREPGLGMPLPLAGLDAIRVRDEPFVIRVPDAARATAWIEGWLVDAEDRPALADRVFSVRRGAFNAWPGNTMPAAETDAVTGHFRVGPFAAGTYTLSLASRTDVDIVIDDIVLRPRETTSLGRRVLPASGVLAVALERDSDLRLADLMVQIDGPGGSDVVPLDLATLRGERRLVPGRYTATVYGTGFRWLTEAIEIRAGETTALRGTLRPAVRVGIRLHMPSGETRASFLIRDARDVLAFDAELDGVASEDWWPFFDRGTFHVEATGGTGRRYATRFAVDSLEPSAELRELRVEPLR
ncbi:MAG: carboxypeptidase regulatory-like domain-containing protein [Planctomycetes bacterium]|nr:carboxypeptidase regulatory-like domain-containing protein [Planctomycetota bacterium]